MNRADAVDQLKKVYRILAEDMDAARELSVKSPSPFSHRTLVRTYFSLVEGLAFQLRQVTLASLEPYPGKLTTAEISLLREERYTLNKKGEPEPGDNYQRVLPNLLFTIQCYLKNHGATFSPVLSDNGWRCMQNSVDIRNRITHPKSVVDLSLSEDDLNSLVEASRWWKKTLFEMFNACDEADKYWTSTLAAKPGEG